MIESTAITALFDGVAARVHASTSPIRTLAVTSTLHKEGTTTVALGMALSLAAFDSTTAVLLVDANWLHPSLTEDADRSAGPGLAECLRDGVALEREGDAERATPSLRPVARPPRAGGSL